MGEPPFDPPKHHASCKPTDVDLTWACNQCGYVEDAEAVLQERDTLRAVVVSARVKLTGYHCGNHIKVLDILTAAVGGTDG